MKKNLSPLLSKTAFIFALFGTVFNVPAQRAIINPSLEDPAIPVGSNQRWSEGILTGWLTTHPPRVAHCTNGGSVAVDCRPIERWGTTFLGVSTAAGARNSFVELNADEPSMIYQPVCLTSGESFTFSLLHRGREGSDIASFRFGIPTGLPSGSKAADTYGGEIVRFQADQFGAGGLVSWNSNTSGAASAPAGNGWRRISGTYTYTGATRLANLGFVANSAAGSISVGNFIDDWSMTLAPYLELRASAGSSFEPVTGSLTPADRPAVRISGTVTSTATATITHSGGTATLGQDFSLTPTFVLGSTINSQVITIPAGTYDGVTTGVFPIDFAIRQDYQSEPDETAIFNVTISGGAVIAPLTNCGGTAISQMTYTITNRVPTAAHVGVAGRVVDADGLGVRNAMLTLTNGSGTQLHARTNPFGYFRFMGLEAGELAVVTVSAKQHTFTNASQSVVLFDGVTEMMFRADPK